MNLKHMRLSYTVNGNSALIGCRQRAVPIPILGRILPGTRDRKAYLVDRYSERKETAAALMERVNLSAAT